MDNDSLYAGWSISIYMECNRRQRPRQDRTGRTGQAGQETVDRETIGDVIQ